MVRIRWIKTGRVETVPRELAEYYVQSGLAIIILELAQPDNKMETR